MTERRRHPDASVQRALSGQAAVAPGTVPSGAGRVLLLATGGFGLNFWAWALISPLGAAYGERLDLTGFQQSALVAVPVAVGSLGRIPVGGLTDRVGAGSCSRPSAS